MLPAECFSEHLLDQTDYLDLPCAGRSMAKSRQGLLGGLTLRVGVGQHQPFFFKAEFLQHSFCHTFEHGQLLCGWRLDFSLDCIQPRRQTLAVGDDRQSCEGQGLSLKWSWPVFLWILSLC